MTPQEWSRIQQGIFKGESGGDYGALFGYQNRPGGKFSNIDLTKMTIDEALEFSNPSGNYGQFVEGQVGRVATPMGAYQVVGSTLRDAKKGLGLSGQETMSKDMQDQIGKWIYKTQGTGAWEGYKPLSEDQAIASQTLQVLGKSPKGILTPTQTSETETKPMMQPQKPRGLFENIGIQKMQEGAEGEAGQRFYNRDSFKDTAATLAQGFGRMGIMGMEDLADQVAGQRTEAKARNKTVEYLRNAGRDDLADAVESRSLNGRDAAGIMFAQPKSKGYETKVIKLADGSEAMVERKKGTNDPWQPSRLPEGATTGTGESTKDLTADQSKLTLFRSMQTETQPVLLALEDQFDPANFQDPTLARIPIAGNYFTSPEYQMYQTAAAAWAEGALRIATGAAATQPEIERNIKTYFAQPGDTPQTVAFKSKMRDMYDRSVLRALGQETKGVALPVPTPKDFAENPTGGDYPNAPAIGTVGNGFKFKGGDPNDRNNWEPV